MYKVTIPTVITNGHFNKEKTLAEIKRCGGERIALAISRELGYAFSSEENLKLLHELIHYYRENGLETVVWLGETFGHGDMQKAKGLYKNIRYIGSGDMGVFCPKDEKFIADFSNWVKNAAKCGADMIMLDDDFRLNYRGGGLGCCCELHMSALRDELGEELSEHGLKEKLFGGGKNKYRDAWIKVQGDAMRHFSKALREALDEVNPDARLGFCCSPNVWDTDGTDAIELARIMAGKNKPFLRLIGAPYWAMLWNNHPLGEVVEHERTQLNWCKNSGIEVFSEGDTYPRPRFATPASYLECFDMILRADGQADGILKYMLDYVSDADHETGYVDAMVKHMDLYLEIDKTFSKKTCVGVKPYNVMHLMENREFDSKRENLLNELQESIFYPSQKFAVVNSLPVTYEDGYVNILFGENARFITQEELNDGNIIDLTAAKILMSRGINVGIESIQPHDFDGEPSEYYLSERVYTRLAGSVPIRQIEHKAGVNLLTQYKFGHNMLAGAFTYENTDGQRFLVYPFDAEEAKNALGWMSGYARRRQVIRSLEWLGKKPLLAYADGNYPMLYVMVKKNESSMSVGLWNLFDDAIDNVKICINDDFDNIRFINCNGHRDGNSVIIDTVLYPYEFAGFEMLIDRKDGSFTSDEACCGND